MADADYNNQPVIKVELNHSQKDLKKKDNIKKKGISSYTKSFSVFAYFFPLHLYFTLRQILSATYELISASGLHLTL